MRNEKAKGVFTAGSAMPKVSDNAGIGMRGVGHKLQMEIRFCIRHVAFAMLLFVATTGGGIAEDVFDRACVVCHVREKVSLRKTFMNALLIYSGKENMKAGLKYFLRHPRRDSSVMGEEFLTRHGLKEPLRLDDAVLDQALEIYWKRYTVHGKLY